MEEMRAKAERDWVEDPDAKSSLNGGNGGLDSKPEADFGVVESAEVRGSCFGCSCTNAT